MGTEILWPGNYDILAGADLRLAQVFGKTEDGARCGRCIALRNDTSRYDTANLAFADAIVRQYHAYRPAFERILESSDPKKQFRAEVQAAHVRPFTFLYGIPDYMLWNSDLSHGSHAMVAAKLGAIEAHVVKALREADGAPLRLGQLTSITGLTSEFFARELFCRYYVRGTLAYPMLKAGVRVADLKSGTVDENTIAACAVLGVPTLYAAAASRMGVTDVPTIVHGYTEDIAVEYLA